MVGQLKQARPVHRSGEPRLGGAEQKPLQQVAWARAAQFCAIKGFPLRGSTVVDALGEQLLSRARLPVDQHRHVVLRRPLGPLHALLELGITPDQIGK